MAQAGFKLIKGDENICALFQKSKNIEKWLGENESSKILQYIYITEIYRLMHIKKLIQITKGGMSLFLHCLRYPARKYPN